MPYITFRTSVGKDVSFQVENDWTILDVKRELVNRLTQTPSQLSPDRLVLTYNRQILDNSPTVADYKIPNPATVYYRITLPPDQYDPDVKPILNKDLRALKAETRRVFVFVGIGSSSENPSNTPETIKRQQCPDAVRDYCRQQQIPLRVLLIDPGFQSDANERQVYKIDTKWVSQGQPEAGGKVRRYQYSESGTDFSLTAYGTKVQPDEYGGKRLEIAGVNLEELVKAIEGNRGFAVIGNFYGRETKPHVCGGDSEVLAQLGYTC
ncbi:MAG TPA: ubiquitin-like domain-containing protein [Gemmataceae bacterium]